MELLPSEIELLIEAEKCEDSRSFFDFLIRKGLLNSKRVNMFAARSMYAKLIKQGYKKMDAITTTAEALCLCEDSVREAVYRHKDI